MENKELDEFLDAVKVIQKVAIKSIKEEQDRLEELNTLCKCGHSIKYHNNLDNNACRLITCKCKGFEQ